MTQMTLLAQTPHSGLTIHTVPAVRRFTGDPSGLRQTQPPHTNKDPSQLSILTARKGRQLQPRAN